MLGCPEMSIDYGVVAFAEHRRGRLGVRAVEVVIQRVVSPRRSFNTFLSGNFEPLFLTNAKLWAVFIMELLNFGEPHKFGNGYSPGPGNFLLF